MHSNWKDLKESKLRPMKKCILELELKTNKEKNHNRFTLHLLELVDLIRKIVPKEKQK